MVIAGPNGAGKTTFAADFLPEFVRCREFLNADMIAAGLSPFSPEKQNVRAGRLLLERIEELASAGENFSFETTLAGVTYVKRLERMKKGGYRVVVFFSGYPVPTWRPLVLRVAFAKADIRSRNRTSAGDTTLVCVTCFTSILRWPTPGGFTMAPSFLRRSSRIKKGASS
jgi:hypothetical protein